MEISDIALGLILGVAGSLIATAICAKYLKKRQQSIRRKIEELDYEEKFIERISKGNVELIRSGFRVFSLCLSIVIFSGAAVLVTHLSRFQNLLKRLFTLLQLVLGLHQQVAAFHISSHYEA